MLRLCSILFLIATLFASNSYADATNKRLRYDTDITKLYSFGSNSSRRAHGDYSILIAMSGGGTRAAALSYGVLKALKEIDVDSKGKSIPLLDEVDFISSVSGGSFTAAYYGLYGDRIFKDFEKDFLYSKVGSDLFWRTLNPKSWFASQDGNNKAISYYKKKLFGDATFGDFDPENSPLVIINATDLAAGVRFSYTQEFFNLICSDISSYPVANAVAASSAVPIVFDPIVLKNHTGCGNQNLLDLNAEKYSNEVTKSLVKGLQSYSDKDQRQYVHLVDGGLTDNLGLLAMYDIINLGKEQYLGRMRADMKPYALAISIDASTQPTSSLDNSPEVPGIMETFNLMNDIQIHRLNDVAKTYYKQSLLRYGQANNIKTYFIDINLSDMPESQYKDYMNNIPTDMELEHEQVDALILAGETLLKNNPTLISFLHSANNK